MSSVNPPDSASKSGTLPLGHVVGSIKRGVELSAGTMLTGFVVGSGEEEEEG